LAIALLSLVGTPTRACSSDQPTFGEAVRGARAIARVTVLSIVEDPSVRETFRVERRLKGSLPNQITIAPAWATLCHDSAASYAGGVGRTAILAIELRYYDQIIHPVWSIDPETGVFASAGTPARVTTLADLESAILAELGMPDTATETEPNTLDESVVPLLTIGLTAFLGVLFGKRSAAGRN
jgi:hypothetical protein